MVEVWGGEGRRGVRDLGGGRELSSVPLSPHYFPILTDARAQPLDEWPALNKLLPTKQKEEWAPQATQQHCRSANPPPLSPALSS